MNPIRVVLVDDHTMFLDSLVRILSDEPEVDVVATASGVSDAIATLVGIDVDVVVLDHRLADGSGLELARRLRDEGGGLAMVMLTGSGDDDLLRQAVAAGCAGFVTKDRAVDELIEAVKAVRAGEAHLSTRQLAAVLRPGAATSSRPALSPRELEVLQHAARGGSNPAIAEAMYLSAHTVKNYMQSAIEKLGAHSKLEAVTIAVREGLVDLGR